MIRDLRKITRGGQYIADFRYDEGIRIRDEFICPSLFSDIRKRGDGLSKNIFLIEVTEIED